MGDAHELIIHDNREVIQWRIKIFCNDDVAKKRRVKNNLAAHEIFELNFYFWNLKADHFRFFVSPAG